MCIFRSFLVLPCAVFGCNGEIKCTHGVMIFAMLLARPAGARCGPWSLASRGITPNT
jgi:hypothetical protein